MIFTVVVTTITSVMMVMMIAMSIRIVRQCSGHEGPCCHICRSLNTSIELDPCISQRHLRAHANPSADQRVHLC